MPGGGHICGRPGHTRPPHPRQCGREPAPSDPGYGQWWRPCSGAAASAWSTPAPAATYRWESITDASCALIQVITSDSDPDPHGSTWTDTDQDPGGNKARTKKIYRGGGFIR